MATGLATTYDAPIIGTDDDDFIFVDDGVQFRWVPAAGNAYTGYQGWLDDSGNLSSVMTTGASRASGTVTFEGWISSYPFQVYPTDISFGFTDGGGGSVSPAQLSSFGAPLWTYDPATGVLDPHDASFGLDAWTQVFFSVNETDYASGNAYAGRSDSEKGQWQLVPQIHNVDIFGGTGNDTILGGQGKEMLFGGDGADLIRASAGEDLLVGGAGDDQLFAGVGKQTLMGGTGNDTIWGGTGAQLLIGDAGDDVLHAGSGPQTVIGGAGDDTLWGGTGLPVLEGGDGNDVLHAGSGNETLYGGAGRDTFDLSAATGHDVVADFQPGRDVIAVPTKLGGLPLTQPKDLLPLVASDADGDAVLMAGSGFRVVLQHVAASRLEAHPADFFKILSP